MFELEYSMSTNIKEHFSEKKNRFFSKMVLLLKDKITSEKEKNVIK